MAFREFQAFALPWIMYGEWLEEGKPPMSHNDSSSAKTQLLYMLEKKKVTNSWLQPKYAEEHLWIHN